MNATNNMMTQFEFTFCSDVKTQSLIKKIILEIYKDLFFKDCAIFQPYTVSL